MQFIRISPVILAITRWAYLGLLLLKIDQDLILLFDPEYSPRKLFSSSLRLGKRFGRLELLSLFDSELGRGGSELIIGFSKLLLQIID